MSKLFLLINMSLDGFIEDAAGEIDWHFADEEFSAFIDETLQ
jgi:dihydrofolate reductase